ncbi:transposase [Corticibacter populi]|uniref:Transposase n=1 Tax=Corticibacter populi TaxID=1550736 RepID=A0A3M6QSM8_9BURK|nr:transposase [Corticibacter populi]
MHRAHAARASGAGPAGLGTFSVLHLLSNACRWRMLPSSLPKWRTAHAYFQIWSEPDEETQVLDGRTQLCLAGEDPQAVEELREAAR